MKGYFVKYDGPTGIPEVYASFLDEWLAYECRDDMNEQYPNILHWVEVVDFND